MRGAGWTRSFTADTAWQKWRKTPVRLSLRPPADPSSGGNRNTSAAAPKTAKRWWLWTPSAPTPSLSLTVRREHRMLWTGSVLTAQWKCWPICVLCASDCVSLAYQRVQKVECTSPRPVLILGPLTDPVKEMLVKESPGKFCRCLLGEFTSSSSLSVRQKTF